MKPEHKDNIEVKVHTFENSKKDEIKNIQNSLQNEDVLSNERLLKEINLNLTKLISEIHDQSHDLNIYYKEIKTSLNIIVVAILIAFLVFGWFFLYIFLKF
ncbi:hypothetical protein [Methanosphaera cuniculi]|uniref:hypothetical protein n=1 Tax=Methanosphaera cuniculi TaxID=1077256 RepID=UPI0026DC1BF1|nr:hypothetical protein [Methanosphaera cuniculi]